MGSSLAIPPWELERSEKGLPEVVEVAAALMGTRSMPFKGAFELAIRRVGQIFGSLIATGALAAEDAEVALLAYWCIPYLLSCSETSEQIRKALAGSEFVDHVNHVSVMGSLR